ncbi:MAG: aminotransferase class I/II-fold pyridoxal phosphate-dependent enzyme [Candidatus Eisenbacteria bacterium]|nr:aminotransferase class I/II-fold pyridoxal phosphate-dependent enzyme [Candidatus Eisenbacteria bacterium]
MFPFAERVTSLPKYAFARTDEMKARARSEGKDLIDLAIGNPDLRPPRSAIDALHRALDDSAHQLHRYSPFNGIPVFREAVARWYKTRFDVDVDPDREVLPVIGSKEGLAKLALAFLNPGDTAIIPSPAYPAYFPSVHVAGGVAHQMPLLEELGFQPDLDAIPADTAAKAKYIVINYPNNPTGGIETDLLEKVVAFGERTNTLVVSDIAYSELPLDDDVHPRSIFQIDRDKKNSIEFQSFSKTYCMAGWRVGFVVGNPEIIAMLYKLKSTADFSVFPAIQAAAADVLTGPQDFLKELRGVYRERRDVLVKGLCGLGWKVASPKAGMYVWTRMPEKYENASQFTDELVLATGVSISPGEGFGKYGAGFVRMALVQPKERIAEAVKRIDAWGGLG